MAEMCAPALSDAAAQRLRRRALVRGVVQGVGFRPFVWQLATDLGLAGWVCNTSGGVVLEVEGDATSLERFAESLRDRAPRLSRVEAVRWEDAEPRGDEAFVIRQSRAVAGEYQPVSPDAATCPDCLRELFDPHDRRYRHPFVNCTACGPRFTIIEDVPYDRPLTTMRAFPMCARCRAEYEDPRDRRFHAQPVCCPDCGPRLWFSDATGVEQPGDPPALAVEALRRGEIVAVKGLGGFQLACDAHSQDAVQLLRARKRRPSKPFAVMLRTLDEVRELCEVSDAEAALLQGTARPVVLLRRRAATRSQLADAVAPGLDEVGVMLPSTPLHHLLLADSGMPLVMTSGNLSEEPIARDNDEALRRLAGVADRFLLHDRDIYARYDDSVVRLAAGEERVLRRARGYCPTPCELGADMRPAGDVLALGAHLKNTFCVLREGHAFVGPHIGEMDTPQALQHQAEALHTYLRLFRAHPRVVACDLHPDLASTRLAEAWWDQGAIPVRVQHHHAHVASVMAEHGLRGPLLGVAFDGLGYGPDGTIWGGELLLCDERDYRRVGHLAVVAQPGGDLAARQGWRMAVAHLLAAGLDPGDAPPDWMRKGEGAPDPRRWSLVARLAATRSTAAAPPRTSSVGRLFDAVAALLGVAQQSSYEGEAAMLLEAAARRWHGPVRPVEITLQGTPRTLDPAPLVRALVEGRRTGTSVPELAAVFHESLALATVRACQGLAEEHGVDRVVLSGGVFQNTLLLARCLDLLGAAGLRAFSNRMVPANDGGISLGQALVAAARQRRAPCA